ncbi:alpha/beta hydrolase [Croceicoccus sp. F390]|uniref:Palmitoyl-protein thioesterase ABHD10, mitochondrial n=1 Tax=Croceicoccus esteveae TaxID=3075597 RepID=A0ABU2ZHR0_9SPHN|nr:alpha/beta hydrolase [Croceicoccus sp. F390]MDT0576148.1 alpha/beta hydrolase [Croceicoccus sp. F390]
MIDPFPVALASFHTPDGTRIAYRHLPGAGPLIVFLPGYMSDMTGTKAAAIMQHCAQRQRACLLLDYSGCGSSEGDFADGTLSRWTGEVVSLLDRLDAGPVLLVGSSMGGWLMLLVALELVRRHGQQAVAGLVGIAPAPDFTRWGYDDAQKAQLAAGTTVYEHNAYGPEPTPTHAAFWQDGQRQQVLDKPICVTAPVRLLHGQRDTDVPWQKSLQLADALTSADVQIMLVKEGDHRLSRDADIALLLGVIDRM